MPAAPSPASAIAEARTGTATPPRRSVARYSALIAVIALLGKAAALLREAIIGYLFGAGPGMDAFFLALSVPNTFSTIVTGSGLRATFQAELARRLADDEKSASRLSTAVTALVFATSVALVGVIFLAAGPLAHHLAPHNRFLEPMLRVVAPMLVLGSLLSVFTGMLHAKFRFAWPALEAAIRNSTLIIVVPLLAFLGVTAVALGHLAGTFLVVLGCALAARRAGFFFARPTRQDRARVARLLRETVPAIVGGSVYGLMALADRAMAIHLGPGAASALAYADPLWQTGLIVAGPVATVALPVLADLAARGERQRLEDTVRTTVRGTLFLTAPIAALLAALAVPAVHALYLRGKFDPAAAQRCAEVVAFLALCLPTAAAQGVTMRVLQADRRFAATAWISLAVLAFHVLLNWPLMLRFGPMGIAISSAASYLLLVVLIDRAIRLPAPGRARFVARLLLAMAAAFAAAFLATRLLPPVAAPLGDALARLASGGILGLLAFVAVAHATKMDELGQTLRFLRARRAKMK